MHLLASGPTRCTCSLTGVGWPNLVLAGGAAVAELQLRDGGKEGAGAREKGRKELMRDSSALEFDGCQFCPIGRSLVVGWKKKEKEFCASNLIMRRGRRRSPLHKAQRQNLARAPQFLPTSRNIWRDIWSPLGCDQVPYRQPDIPNDFAHGQGGD